MARQRPNDELANGTQPIPNTVVRVDPELYDLLRSYNPGKLSVSIADGTGQAIPAVLGRLDAWPRGTTWEEFTRTG